MKQLTLDQLNIIENSLVYQLFKEIDYREEAKSSGDTKNTQFWESIVSDTKDTLLAIKLLKKDLKLN